MSDERRKLSREQQWKFLEEFEFPSAAMNDALVGRGGGKTYKKGTTLTAL
jgi:hypothetical protein